MSLFHAVVWMDQQEAHVVQFDAEAMQAQRIKSRSHHLREHKEDARALHQYFEQVAAALTDVHEVLLVGPGLAHDEFKAWADKHHPAVAKALVGSEKADHPTDPQLVALARRFFLKFDRMAGTPTPM
jgi:stalled ribosome rescue protein Dom34